MISSNKLYLRAVSLLTCVSTLILSAPLLPVEAKPASRPAAGNAIYERAKKQLPKDIYVLYRIVDRISRANGLDERPWRIGVVPKYDINAFATDVNLVAMYTGILDQLAGDASALACVVGHEMAHSVKKHVALSQAQQVALVEKFRKEAEEEVNREANSARSEAAATSVAGSVLGSAVGGLIGGLGNSALQGASNRRLQTAEARIQEIVKKKQAALQQQVAESSRTQEFEADELGYLYIARAGFEPEGCLRSMEVLARTPGAELDSTHPAVPRRIEALKQLMVKNPPAALAAEGKNRLKSPPLTYDLSKDGQSLRINSRFGGASESDIDRLFGQ